MIKQFATCVQSIVLLLHIHNFLVTSLYENQGQAITNSAGPGALTMTVHESNRWRDINEAT